VVVGLTFSAPGATGLGPYRAWTRYGFAMLVSCECRGRGEDACGVAVCLRVRTCFALATVE
jgi:hypothetical protein